MTRTRTASPFANWTREQFSDWNAEAFALFSELLQAKASPEPRPLRAPSHRFALLMDRVKASPGITPAEICAEFGYPSPKAAKDAIRRARVTLWGKQP